MSPTKVALLINFVTPYHRPVFQILSSELGEFRIFSSVEMEPNRNWQSDWTGLDVVLQRNIMFSRRWDHPKGFSDTTYIHFPYDTIIQLMRYKPQVVISTEMGIRSLQALFYCMITRSSRLILWLPLSEHTEQGRGQIRAILRRFLLQNADAFLVNGRSGARHIKNFGVHEDSIFYVPYPSDHEKFFTTQPNRNKEVAYRLLYVGQLIERKGIIPFTESLIRWSNNNPTRTIEFTLVGEGELQQNIAQLPTPPNLSLRLLGHQPYDQLKKIYGESGLFVFPTYADEWGIVVNEALISGLPVLGSVYSQAVEELVEDGKSGWLFMPDDPEDVYRSIDRALNTPLETLNKMRLSSQELGKRCHPEKVAENMLSAISFVQ